MRACFGLLLWVACSGIDVRWDWDRSARFDQLRRWAWLPGQAETLKPDEADPRVQNSLVRQRIQSAVEAALAARGYASAAPPEADFYVTYHAAIDEKLDTHTVDPRYGPYSPAYGGPGETYIEQYEVGTLIVDVLDAHTRQLMWRGIAKSRLQELKDPAQREERMRDAVNKIFARFPPTTT